MLLFILTVLTLLNTSFSAGAVDSGRTLTAEKFFSESSSWSGNNLLARNETGSAPQASPETSDAYDPFADYSEFEDSKDEAEDILFFKTGRFLSVGAYGGLQFFTGAMANYLDYRVPQFGGFLTYFLNLSSSIQVSALFSSHPFYFRHAQLLPIDGYYEYYTFSFSYKHYFDKRKLAASLAVLNPYFISGFTYTLRPSTLFRSREDTKPAPVKGFGAQAGLGFEVHISKNFFMGIESEFNFVTFEDELQPISGPSQEDPSRIARSNQFLTGDMVRVLLLIGVNF